MVILASKNYLEKREKKFLAPYAVLSSESPGREFPETPDHTRTEFQRDRDRIIFSKAFRRLSGKTQVFVATYGDHFRDRLSHTLEVAQVARDLARNLQLNEDLCEAIALAHDLGHTPFGHAGEYTLNELMQRFGLHFEHNEQSKRIVEELERQFPAFNGLNLTHEVRQGLAKHQTLYDRSKQKIIGKTLEAQVVDLADEIAYHNHDLDDGLRSSLFTTRDLGKLALWRKAEDAVKKKYGSTVESVILRRRTVSQLISLMIQNVLETGSLNIGGARLKNAVDVLKKKKNLVVFSAGFEKSVHELRKFLWNRMYQSPAVLRHSRKGQRVIKVLFRHFMKHPEVMPKRFSENISDRKRSASVARRVPTHVEASLSNKQLLATVVKDYIAGCTDQYATKLAQRL